MKEFLVYTLLSVLCSRAVVFVVIYQSTIVPVAKSIVEYDNVTSWDRWTPLSVSHDFQPPVIFPHSYPIWPHASGKNFGSFCKFTNIFTIFSDSLSAVQNSAESIWAVSWQLWIKTQLFFKQYVELFVFVGCTINQLKCKVTRKIFELDPKSRFTENSVRNRDESGLT